MKYLYAILLATVIGCQRLPQVTNPYPEIGLPIAQARLDLASGDKAKVTIDLDQIESAAKEISAEYVDTQQMRAEDDAFITKHKNDWTGARFQRWEKWVVLLGFPLFAIVGGVLTYTGGLPAAAHIFFGLLSGGLHFVHISILWVINKFKKKPLPTPIYINKGV